MTDLLRVSDLSLSYGSEPSLVSGLSFELLPGESLGIAGPSGAGKTLLATSLLGLAPPTVRVRGGHAAYQLKSGLAVNVFELNHRERSALRGHEIALVFQEPQRALNPVLRCGRQLREAARMLRPDLVDVEDHLYRTLEQVELGAQPERVLRALPGELSGGQLQRLVIAMALIGQPRLLIADEPTTALDGITQAAIVKLLDRLRQELKMGLLFITHDRRLLERATDRVIQFPVRAGRFITPTQGSAYSESTQRGSVEQPLLCISELAITYGAGPATVSDLSLQLREGESVAITGPSGCGKTTLARWLVGLVEGSHGALTVADQTYHMPVAGRTVRRVTTAQLIFQDVAGSLNPRMTVRQLLRSVPGSTYERSADLLAQLGLPPQDYAHRLPDQLSGGERQRVAIARALAARPRILICDEAFSGLDVATRTAIQRKLRQLVTQQGLTLVTITHSLPDILDYADRVLVMEHGRVMESGVPAAVFGRPQASVTQQLVAAAGLGGDKPKPGGPTLYPL